MPTITISREDIHQLIGRDISDRALSDVMEQSKVGYHSITGDEMMLEIPSDRPDLLSAEGIARELRGLLKIETGLVRYTVGRSNVSIEIDPTVRDVRPCIVSAVVEDIVLSDLSIRQLMQLQEKLHMSYGRTRRKVSVGVHDLDKITHRLTYAGVDPDKIRFVPLGEEVPMSGTQILRETSKGREYGHIIEAFPRYPLLFDSDDNVLSLPPIINGVLTTVTESTRNLLLDVTGTETKLVKFVLNIITTSLRDRGGIIKSVLIRDGKRRERTPNLQPNTRRLRAGKANELIGTQLEARQIASLLERMRYGIKDIKADSLTVDVPSYRTDVLHEVDLIEDVAIAYGLEALQPEVPFTPTIGRSLDITRFSGTAREIMVGFGFQEVISYVMTSSTILFEKMGREPTPVVEVANPIVEEYSILRCSLLPGLLSFLGYNKHVSYPQRVFECGDVVLINDSRPTGTENQKRVAAAISDHKVSYEDIQSVLYGFLMNLNVTDWSIKPSSDPSFIDGRCATIEKGQNQMGVVGEISPDALLRFSLENPTAAFEISLDSCMNTHHTNLNSGHLHNTRRPPTLLRAKTARL